MTITNDQIQAAALASGFTLKPQPDGGMALHPYVFEFARAVLATGQQAAQDQIADLRQQLERTSERYRRANLLVSQWQQRAAMAMTTLAMAERQRDELAELIDDQPACPECGGSSIVAELPMDGGAIQYQPCTRCCGTGEIHKTQLNELTYVCIRCSGTGKEPA